MSARPPTKSNTSPVSGSRNMPLMVKSRRRASSSGAAARTLTGWRPSRYSASARNVATSIGWPWITTSTTPNWAPTGTVRAKRLCTRSAEASVATSKSAGGSSRT